MLSGGETGAIDGEMPLAHRLAVAYLAAPLMVWLLGWFRWWFGAPAAALLAAGLWKALSGSWRIRLTARLSILMLVALAWVVSTPVGGLAAIDGGDWLGHRAQLLDLARDGWPTYPTDWLNDQPPLMNFYLGWHMMPALIGQWFGAAALNWAVPLWTWAGVVLVLALFTRDLPTLRATCLAAIMLVAFSGMDAIEYLLFEGPADALQLLHSRIGRNLVFITSSSSQVLLEYQSNALTFRYSPHHLITSGLAVLIICQLRHHRCFLAVSGLVLTVCLFWSPLASLGLLLLVVTLILKNGIRPFMKWPNLIVAPILAALLVLYLNAGRSDLYFAWLWERYDNLAQMMLDLLVVYLGEFLLLAYLLLWMDRRLVRDPFFIVSMAVLLLVPLFVYGDTEYSAPILRVSLPALLLLCWYATRAAISRLPEMVDHPMQLPNTSPLTHAILVVMLAFGAISATFEFYTTLSRIGMTDYAQTAISYKETPTYFMVESTPTQITEKTTYSTPGLLQILLKSNEGNRTGELLFENTYSIYLRDDRLIYVNRDCQPYDESHTTFLLDIYPVDPTDLPITARQQGYESLDFEWDDLYIKSDTDCVTGSPKLPDYDIASITTCQSRLTSYCIWQVKYDWDSETVIESTFITEEELISSIFDTIATLEPLIDSAFNVYINQGHLIYARQPCRSEDTEPTFFLHIIPENLPNKTAVGFDNQDFRFVDNGIVFGDRCLAIVKLPLYEIARIRTGQWDSSLEQQLWQSEAAVSG